MSTRAVGARATLLLVAAVMAASCVGGRTQTIPSAEYPQAAPAAPELPPPLYAPTSPWNTPIPSAPQIDPESAAMIRTVQDAARSGGFLIAVKKWSWPIYFADATSPRYTVRLTARWAAAPALTGVPIPLDARPSPDGDGHIAIIDQSSGCEYDFWQANKDSDGTWSASWANALDVNGNGWYPDGGSATGSGAAGAAGIIRPEELAVGVIPHALALAYPYTKTGGPVLPATESDGKSSIAGAIPEGAHLQLDPDLDLTSLGLKPYELIIARAMQQYGLYVTDSGSGVTIVAQNPQSTARAYPWGDRTYVYLPEQLLGSLRVLALPPQYRQPNVLPSSRCAAYARN